MPQGKSESDRPLMWEDIQQYLAVFSSIYQYLEVTGHYPDAIVLVQPLDQRVGEVFCIASGWEDGDDRGGDRCAVGNRGNLRAAMCEQSKR